MGKSIYHGTPAYEQIRFLEEQNEALQSKVERLEALADSFEELSKKEPDERLFKANRRDCRVAYHTYGLCAKRIRKVIND